MSKILIIEDEAAIRRVLGKIISEENDSYKVEEAEDGLKGIELIKDQDYDLVLCDIKMPKMDGMDALERNLIELPQSGFALGADLVYGYRVPWDDWGRPGAQTSSPKSPKKLNVY